jgi:hypothetical protein
VIVLKKMVECNNTANNEQMVVIDEAEGIQQRTKDALLRIQQQAAQTEELGACTLEHLQEQRYQMKRIQMDAATLDIHLSKTKRLQDRCDRWAGNWFGAKRRAASDEAAEQMAAVERARTKGAIGGKRGAMILSSKKKGDKQGPGTVVIPYPFPSTMDSSHSDENDGEIPQLDEESKAGLRRIEKADDAIDCMMDETSEALARLANISAAMQEETKTTNGELGEVTETLGMASSKQAYVNARVKGTLRKGWLSSTTAARVQTPQMKYREVRLGVNKLI